MRPLQILINLKLLWSQGLAATEFPPAAEEKNLEYRPTFPPEVKTLDLSDVWITYYLLTTFMIVFYIFWYLPKISIYFQKRQGE